jgi:hypothetical protein
VVADEVNDDVGAATGAAPARGLRARTQPPTAVALLIVQVTSPEGPAVPVWRCASSDTWAPVLSHASAQPDGAVTAFAMLSSPTPPISIAPSVTVVVLGTVRVVPA